MAQEWFYTRDGKDRLGPISAAELLALAKSGKLWTTDMVFKQGMSQWMPASSVKGLFTNYEPNPCRTTMEQAPIELGAGSSRKRLTGIDGQRGTWSAGAVTPTLIRRWSLGLTVGLSLLAAVCALTRLGGDILSPVIAGAAILAGFVAVAVGLSAKDRFASLGSAATAVFLGLASLVFSIGATIADQKIKEARDLILRAADIQEDRQKAEEAWVNAEKAREAKVAEPRRILKLAEEKEAQLVIDRKKFSGDQSQLKEEKNKLREDQDQFAKDRNQLEKDQAKLLQKEAELAKGLGQLKADQDKLANDKDKQEKNLAKREKDLLTEPTRRLKEAQAKLEVAGGKEKAAMDLEARADQKAKAATEKEEAAKKKEAEAQDHLKKIRGEYEKLHKQLQSKKRSDKVLAIKIMLAVAPFPATIKPEVRDLNSELCHSLCQITVSTSKAKDAAERTKDRKVRQDALLALQAIEPEFAPLVKEIVAPPDDISAEKYVEFIHKAAAFGRAATPVLLFVRSNQFVESRSGRPLPIGNEDDPIRTAAATALKKIEEKSK